MTYPIERIVGKRPALVLAIALLAVLHAGVAHAQLGAILRVRAQGNTASQQSQGRIDKISEQTDQLLSEYRSTLQQIDSLKTYNAQLEELIAAQDAEVASLREQIENVTVVGRGVTPLMLRMIESLERFIELDVPFLPDERRDRVMDLREMMARADVSDAEKYRRILEAFQIENEYGRTIEAYRGSLEFDGEARTVDFLRVGRLALLYQTLDQGESGVWDQRSRNWISLDGDYRSSIRDGLRIARKQAAPDLITLPVAAPEELQ